MTALQAGVLGLLFGSVAFLAAHFLITGSVAVEVQPVDARPPTWPAIVTLGLFAAVEEAIFRLGIIGLGSRLVGFPIALGTSLVLFAAVHRTQEVLSPTAWVNLILVGAMLGFLYHDFGFFAALGFHWAWNAWEWGLGYAVSGEKNRNRLPAPPAVRRLPQMQYGPEAHWASGAVLAASLLGLLLVRP